VPAPRSLLIERTKFFKTRLIPLPRSTCVLLDHYLQHRRQWVSRTGESPALFISTLGHRLGRGALEARFRQLLREVGIYRPRRREGHTVFGSTNLHALRHTYAVRALERWQRQACEVDHLLPLLTAYMGHVNVTYTTHYLHLTPLLMQLACERFGEAALSRLDHRWPRSDGDE
jgi:integrase